MTETPPRLVVVGRVTGIYGVRGWLRIFSYTDPPQNILRYGPWLLGDSTQTWRVLGGAVHGRGVIAHLEGIEDREAARALAGSTISVPRDRFAEPKSGEYYWSDLIGLTVVDEQGKSLGRVEKMLETGANDVMVVVGDKRRLLPFVHREVVRQVDVAGGVIHVAWDE